ncbi:hypothetical protein JCM10450v2_007144 [Rhodotorula kratochvilovae]
MLRPTGFHSARLVFRAVRFPADDATFERFFADPAVRLGCMPGVCAPMGKADLDKWRKWNEEIAPGFAMIVSLPTSTNEPSTPGEPIGWVCLARVGTDGGIHRKGEFGCFIAAPHCGKGYATEAIEWVLEMAFVSYGLHRVEGGVFSWNKPALRVYEKAGFTIEGRRRDAFWIEGSFHDDIQISILEDEYRARHPEKFHRLLE